MDEKRDLDLTDHEMLKRIYTVLYIGNSHDPLLQRVAFLEDRLASLTKVLVVVGGTLATSVVALLFAILTHNIHLP